MRLKKSSILWFLIAAVLFVVLISFVMPQTSRGDLETVAIVKLYSGEKLVATWNATGSGRLEGNTFVFPVKIGTTQAKVRICGTYIVETVP